MPPHSSLTVSSASWRLDGDAHVDVALARVCRMALATRLVSARFSSGPLPYHGGGAGHRPGEPHPLGGGQGFERGQAVGDEVVEGDRLAVVRAPPAWMRDRSNRSSTIWFSRSTDAPDLLVVDVGLVDHAVLERLGHGPQPGQRGAQVVRDPGHQVAARRLERALPLAGVGERGCGGAELAAHLLDLGRQPRAGLGRHPAVAELGHGRAQPGPVPRQPAAGGVGGHGHDDAGERGQRDDRAATPAGARASSARLPTARRWRQRRRPAPGCRASPRSSGAGPGAAPATPPQRRSTDHNRACAEVLPGEVHATTPAGISSR